MGHVAVKSFHSTIVATMFHLRAFLTLTLFCGPAVAGQFEDRIRPLLETHCLDCHDPEAKKGGLDLSPYRTESAATEDRSLWMSVYEKVESHQMPPPKGKSQPTQEDREMILSWIMKVASQPDPKLGEPDPGKPVLRRLTRLEYNNTVRDLFGLEMDIFTFPDRLPLAGKAYFKPAGGAMGEQLNVPVREYGLKYPVLLPDLGLPGENRAEHGFRNRGEAMNLSPMLLEQYLAAAREIVNSPKLPRLSNSFRALTTDPALPIPVRPNWITSSPTKDQPVWAAVKEFAPNLNLPHQAKEGEVVTLDYQFRFAMESAVAEGIGGVWDATGRNLVIPAGENIHIAYGPNHSKALRLTPREALWVAGFSTAGETSGESLFTNHEKGKKVIVFDLAIDGGEPNEGVSELAVCALSRDMESGRVEITVKFSGGGSATLAHEIIAGGGRGNTFYAFRAPKNEHIVELKLDGSKFTGNYALFDDLAFLTSSGGAPAKRSSIPTMSNRAKRGVAEERLTGFLPRVFRRPLDASTIKRYLTVFDATFERSGDFPTAMKSAMAAALASPEFLYIAESGLGKNPVRPLSDHELATRLAYFLWSAPPDDILLELAKRDQLSLGNELETQTLRMLRDPRARELSESFAAQWLRLDQLMTAKPDPKVFKNFYSGTQGKVTLHSSMLVEALLLFETVLIENRSILDFIDADYTWLNHRLTKVYSIDVPAFQGMTTNSNVLIDAKQNAKWIRVPLTDKRRGGYMTMAAPLTVTSLPTRTSPVKRGAWLLETIFNRPPQEPKIAFVLKEPTSAKSTAATVRARFEEHRDQPACFSCHIRLDPPGFALERFDGIGAWREKDGDHPVDAKAEWLGQPFDGPAEYKALIAGAPHEFTRGFIEHLLSYALARKLDLPDMPTVAKIQAAAAADGNKLHRIILEIVHSYPFNHLRAAP